VFAADFFQLLFVCLQWQAFRLEKRARSAQKTGKVFEGGDNACILKEIENEECQNPYDDFLSNKK